MDRFNLHLRNDEFFEDLVWRLCVRLFGIGVSKFSPGKDGGKDARFVGTAERYPSTKSPWSGTVIIQAKHIGLYNASCSNPEFETLMNGEKPKIQALADAGDLTHYLCITNRKRSGMKGDKVEKTLRKALKIPHFAIEGIETIEGLLVEYSDLAESMGLHSPAPGLSIHPEDLEKLILYFDENIDLFAADPLAPSEPLYQFTELAEKNSINSLSVTYSKDLIEDESVQYMKRIEDFLKDPRNAVWRKRYNNVTAQLRHAYTVHRDDFGAFEKIFQDILNRLHARGQVPGTDKLTITFLHYMYFFCDFGRRTPKPKS